MSEDLQPFPKGVRISGTQRSAREVGRRWVKILVENAGLLPNDAVLDIGCGLGRIAEPLTGYLSERGIYEGFDIDADAIRWCNNNITARYPQFRFKRVDLYNKRYNPEGKAVAEDFIFPFEERFFDVAFLASVFTHLLPQAVDNYLNELARVLKPGGRCVASYFLLNESSEEKIRHGQVHPPRRNFPHRLGVYRVQSKEVPEAAVAHSEEAIRKLYAKHRLQILEPVRYGRWAGGRNPLGNQDIILATKP